MTLKDNEPMPMDFDRDAVLAAFLAETDEGLAAMEQALIALESGSADRDLLNDIFRVAHTIKGNGSYLGAAELVARCAELEALAHDGALAAAPALLERARAAYARLAAALDAAVATTH